MAARRPLNSSLRVTLAASRSPSRAKAASMSPRISGEGGRLLGQVWLQVIVTHHTSSTTRWHPPHGDDGLCSSAAPTLNKFPPSTCEEITHVSHTYTHVHMMQSASGPGTYLSLLVQVHYNCHHRCRIETKVFGLRGTDTMNWSGLLLVETSPLVNTAHTLCTSHSH